MSKEHNYTLSIKWTGNTGQGTSDYQGYERSHIISMDGKPSILVSSDPNFRGDPGRHNPEELLLASISSCHMLWYLHLCADADVVVTTYEDHPTGVMVVNDDGSGQFNEITLHPQVTVTDESMMGRAITLHKKAGELCFITRSVNFPVKDIPSISVA